VETEPALIENYIATGKVKLVYRHLLQLGDGSLRTGEASECAADQNAFWPMRSALYARQSEVYGSGDLDATLSGFAGDLGLDTAAFGECMRSHKHAAVVEADYRAAQAEGVQSRPVFQIGRQRLIGALPLATFQKQLDAELAR
jgi:protein-disulfide isomerase